MYVLLDPESGEMKKWEPPMPLTDQGKNVYYPSGSIGCFVVYPEQVGTAQCQIWHVTERKLYDINMITREYKEAEVGYDYCDLMEHEPGFMERSEWMTYCLNENVFNSLKDLLDDHITGNTFDRNKQKQAFMKINANTDGSCGKNIHTFIKRKIE